MRNPENRGSGFRNAVRVGAAGIALTAVGVVFSGCNTENGTPSPESNQSATEQIDLLNFTQRATCGEIIQVVNERFDENGYATYQLDGNKYYVTTELASILIYNTSLGVYPVFDTEKVTQQQVDERIDRFQAELEKNLMRTNVKNEGGLQTVYEPVIDTPGGFSVISSVDGARRGWPNNDVHGCPPEGETSAP